MKARLSRHLAEQARSRRQQCGVRTRRIVERTGPGLRVRVDGVDGVNFAGNDYLGLAAEAEPARAVTAGASASPLITGYHPVHHQLERALADFTGFEAVALFPSGYQANLAVGQALLQRGRGALADRLNHASLNDGLRLAGARIRRFAHADPAAAAARLDDRIDVIASDGVFSMDGDLAPLAALADLATRHDTPLWLDDAHGFGVLGRDGRGVLEHLAVDVAAIDVFVATFGKALGTAGAFVAGDRALIEHLENVARPLIYSTALSPLLSALTLTHLERLRAESWRRERSQRAHRPLPKRLPGRRRGSVRITNADSDRSGRRQPARPRLEPGAGRGRIPGRRHSPADRSGGFGAPAHYLVQRPRAPRYRPPGGNERA